MKKESPKPHNTGLWGFLPGWRIPAVKAGWENISCPSDRLMEGKLENKPCGGSPPTMSGLSGLWAGGSGEGGQAPGGGGERAEGSKS